MTLLAARAGERRPNPGLGRVSGIRATIAPMTASTEQVIPDLSEPDDLTPVVLDVWSDIACPWCWIGHTRLAQTISTQPVGTVIVRHRGFELQPDMAREGVAARPFFEHKFGSADAVTEGFGRVAAVGAELGLVFNFDAMPKAPNSRLAHRAVLISDQTVQLAALHSLFEAYFSSGLDITDVDVVAAVVAAATGADTEDLRARLLAGDGEDAMERDIAKAQDMGVSAVPTFVANNMVAVEGAQPPAGVPMKEGQP